MYSCGQEGQAKLIVILIEHPVSQHEDSTSDGENKSSCNGILCYEGGYTCTMGTECNTVDRLKIRMHV